MKAQAGEQSRLDTAERQAGMEIQRTQMGAEEAMQAARLGEASKLQMAEATEQSRLDTQEAMGAMEVQRMKGEGEMWETTTKMDRESTLMSSGLAQAKMYGEQKTAADEKMWGGVTDTIGAFIPAPGV